MHFFSIMCSNHMLAFFFNKQIISSIVFCVSGTLESVWSRCGHFAQHGNEFGKHLILNFFSHWKKQFVCQCCPSVIKAMYWLLKCFKIGIYSVLLSPLLQLSYWQQTNCLNWRAWHYILCMRKKQGKKSF